MKASADHDDVRSGVKFKSLCICSPIRSVLNGFVWELWALEYSEVLEEINA